MCCSTRRDSRLSDRVESAAQGRSSVPRTRGRVSATGARVSPPRSQHSDDSPGRDVSCQPTCRAALYERSGRRRPAVHPAKGARADLVVGRGERGPPKSHARRVGHQERNGTHRGRVDSLSPCCRSRLAVGPHERVARCDCCSCRLERQDALHPAVPQGSGHHPGGMEARASWPNHGLIGAFGECRL